ncbi:MAG: hypothetical protein ACP5VC_18205 [Bryobacteraceae bacterium]
MSTTPQADSPSNPQGVSILVDFMRLLDEPERVAVRLFYLGAFPEEEVCRQTGVDIERFRQIRKDLRDLWRASVAWNGGMGNNVASKRPRRFFSRWAW